MSSYGEIAQTASIVPAATVMQNASTANGNGTNLSVTGFATALLSITASVAMSGGTTINFEASSDGTTFVPIIGTQVGTTNTNTITSSTGDWTFNIAGYNYLRARISAYSAGTITVKGYASVVAGAGSGNGAVELLDSGGTNKASISAGGALKVDGSATTQPVSAASLPLPSGASTAAKQPTLGTAGSASSDVITVQGIASMTALKVDGSGVTQPISAASLPLPSGAATAAKQPALGTAGSAATDVITVQGISSMTALKVDGSGVTQPVSAASLPLPSGAATAAKQPALGTAGSASTDVVTVQGISSMTALKVDGSAVTQPVSGTITVNAGSNLNTSALALESGGNLATLAGAVSSSKLQVNTALINGVAPSMGNGASGTGVQRVTIANDSTGQIAQTASIMPSGVTMQNAATANGNGTSLTSTGYATAILNITASVAMSGGTTINFEASVDGTTWVSILGTQVGTSTAATSTTSVGDWVFNISGYNNLRARISAYSAGTITVKGFLSVVGGGGGGGNLGGTVTANAGTNLNTSLLALESGGNLATIAGTVSSSKLQANTAQINGVAPSMGNGISGTGVQRVTIASDSSGQVALASGTAVQLLDSGGTNKVSISSGGAISVADATAQAASSTGQHGPMVQGAVATSAPTYTTGQVMPLSLTTAGALRVDAGTTGQGAVTQSGTWANQILDSGGTNKASVSAAGALSVALSAPPATFIVCNTILTPASSPQDMIQFAGSSTKVCKVRRVRLFTYTNSAESTNEWYLIKRSKANTGGTTTTAPTAVSLDSGNAAVTAAVTLYTANPSNTGTSGNVTVATVVTPLLGASSFYVPPFYDLFVADESVQPITLRNNSGDQEVLCLNFGGVSLPSGMKVKLEIIWTEE